MNGGGSRPIVEPVPDGQGTTWSFLVLPSDRKSEWSGLRTADSATERREVSSSGHERRGPDKRQPGGGRK